MKNRYVHAGLTIIILAFMCAAAIALWRGMVPIEWLASFGYKGIFVLSLINGIAPVGGLSQIATFFVASKLNPLAVGLAAGVGGAIGELAGYAFGYFLRAAQSDAVESKIQRVANWRFLRVSRERSFIPLFVLASIPNPFFDPASALAGSLRIGFAQYFIPVLLGKTVRYLVIAYVGYYTLSGNLGPVFDKTSMTNYLYVVVFVGLVLFIALIVWGIRSIFEEEPDPLLLNFTFFAFAAQCILTVEAYKERIVLVLLAPAVLLLLAQMFVIREQVNKTRERYKKVLRDKSIGSLPAGEIENWADILLRITGVDFFPEFYQDWIKFGNPREKRREQAVEVLPRDKFKCGEDTDGVIPEALLIPPEERQGLWRRYAWICFFSWFFFIICIIAARWNQ